MAMYVVVVELELEVEAPTKHEAQKLAGSVGFETGNHPSVAVRRLVTFPPIKEGE